MFTSNFGHQIERGRTV